jgi:site-specific DNA-methyltransferase (adenine-specific)
VERPLLATCPERVCLTCGQAWQRERVARSVGHLAVVGDLRPACRCGAVWQPGVVLDPFIGSGTTAVVAERLGRDWLGIELNPNFAMVAEQRVVAISGGHNEEEQSRVA